MTQTKILVVDDEAVLRMAVTKRLKAEDYAVTEAPGIMAALQLLEERSFDLILSDLNMPDGDGTTIVKELHRLQKPQRTPFILMTASVELSIEAANDLGIDSVFYKPFDIKALLRRIAICLTPVPPHFLRRRGRVSSILEASLLLPHRSTAVSVQALNIGVGGVFVHVTDNFPNLHEKVQCQIFFKNLKTPFSAVGQVRWVRSQAQDGFLPGIGIEFVTLTPTSRHFLANWINALKTTI